MSQSKIQRLQRLLKQAKHFADYILDKRYYWNDYGQKTGSKLQWSSHMSTFLVKFTQAFRNINLDDLLNLETIIQQIKEWFRNAAYEWKKIGQGGTGEAFADWLSLVQKMLQQLIKKINQLLNQEKAKQAQSYAAKKSELDQIQRLRKQKEEEQEIQMRKKSQEGEHRQNRQRSRQGSRPNRQMPVINEELQQQRKNLRQQQIFIQSQRNWLNEKIQRKTQECNKLSQELQDEKLKLQSKNEECIRLTHDLEYEKIKNKSLESFSEELNRQITAKTIQVQRLKRSNFQNNYA